MQRSVGHNIQSSCVAEIRSLMGLRKPLTLNTFSKDGLIQAQKKVFISYQLNDDRQNTPVNYLHELARSCKSISSATIAVQNNLKQPSDIMSYGNTFLMRHYQLSYLISACILTISPFTSAKAVLVIQVNLINLIYLIPGIML